MTDLDISPELIAKLIGSLEGVQVAKSLSLTSLTLILYEYLSTIHEEVEYFWKGPWSLSCVLFLLNRYLAPLIMIFILTLMFAPGLTTEVCTPAVKAVFILTVLGIILVQAILALRVWYLYSHSISARILVVTVFVSTPLTTFIFIGQAFAGLNSIVVPGLTLLGCGAPPTTKMWRIFVPPLVLHTILYMFTTYKAIRNKQFLKSSPVLMSLLRDGGIFYLVIFLAAGFTAIGAFFVNVPQVNLPAIYSGFLFSISSVAISRLMLNLRSLAAKLGSNEAFLFNNVELSRVEWKWGAREGEIIAHAHKDIEDDIELMSSKSCLPRDEAAITATRIGMLEDSDPNSYCLYTSERSAYI